MVPMSTGGDRRKIVKSWQINVKGARAILGLLGWIVIFSAGAEGLLLRNRNARSSISTALPATTKRRKQRTWRWTRWTWPTSLLAPKLNFKLLKRAHT